MLLAALHSTGIRFDTEHPHLIKCNGPKHQNQRVEAAALGAVRILKSGMNRPKPGTKWLGNCFTRAISGGSLLSVLGDALIAFERVFFLYIPDFKLRHYRGLG